MFKVISTAILICAGTGAWAGSCAPRDYVTGNLAGKYGEARQGIGLTETQIVEIFANEETGTWTIFVTLPNGLACVVASGTAFEWVNETVALGDPT
jgi:hypothetical protein